MYTLWYHTSCPFSRQARAILTAMELRLQIRVVEYWKEDQAFAAVSDLCILPVLSRPDIGAVEGVYAIIEYLMCLSTHSHLFPRGTKVQCELRKLLSLINERFYFHVTKAVVDEKFIRLVLDLGCPSTARLRSASSRQSTYLSYFTYLVKERRFLVWDKISIADVALASHISVLDYFGSISWYRYPSLKEWYQVIKSLPYFRVLLEERLSSFTPPIYYKQLDF